jgi:hypothetical protein
MSSLASQVSQRQKVRTALERLDGLEGDFQTVTAQFNNAVSVLQNQLSGITEIVDAVIRHVGVDTVTALVVAERENKAKLRAQQSAEQVAKLVEQGVLVAADTIGNDSFIIGYETDKSNAPVNTTGRVQLQFSQIALEYQDKLRNATVGFKLDTDTGTFEVKEIYNIVQAAANAAAEAMDAAAANTNNAANTTSNTTAE